MPGADDLSRACSVLFDWVLNWHSIGIVRPKYVAIEAPLKVIDRFHSTRSAEVLMSLYGAGLTATYKINAIPLKGEVSAVRDYFIGTHHLNSAETEKRIAARCRQFGWEIENHDQGDAAALWAWAMARVNKRWLPNGQVIYGNCVGRFSA
jgi:hypothetical protein